MLSANLFPLIAADVGNARLKLGRFAGVSGGEFPEPVGTLQVATEEADLGRIETWLTQAEAGGASWWIGSVNRPATSRLIDWLRAHRPDEAVTLLAAGDLPLAAAVERPDMVGIDRLLDAVAANRLRQPDRPAIVVDLGTAITVDLISGDGVFLGGAIGPGIAMSARAMHEFTDLLPEIAMSELADPPGALGRSTEPAMRSGLYWGAVGAVRELIDRLGNEVEGEPEVFVSGGASPAVAGLLGPAARHVAHLTLAGICLTAQATAAR